MSHVGQFGPFGSIETAVANEVRSRELPPLKRSMGVGKTEYLN